VSYIAVWLAVKFWSEWVMYACYNTITRSPPLTIRWAFDVAVELLQNIDGLGLVLLVGFLRIVQCKVVSSVPNQCTCQCSRK